MIYCNLTFIRPEDAKSIFQVTDILKGKDGRVRRQMGFNVCQNELEFDIKCTCHLFEFRGIICRHICKVFIERDVKEIPSQYILPR